MADVKKYQIEVTYDDVALDFRVTGVRKNPSSTLAGGTDIMATFASTHESARDKNLRTTISRAFGVIRNEFAANGV